MARKVKIPNHKQKRSARDSYKENGIQKIRESTFLSFVKEKKRTKLFRGFKNDLPKGVLTSCRIDIEGTGEILFR